MEQNEEHEFNDNKSSNKIFSHGQHTEARLKPALIQEVVEYFFLTLREWTSHSTVPQKYHYRLRYSANYRRPFSFQKITATGEWLHNAPSIQTPCPSFKDACTFRAFNDYIDSSRSTEGETPGLLIPERWKLGDVSLSFLTTFPQHHTSWVPYDDTVFASEISRPLVEQEAISEKEVGKRPHQSLRQTPNSNNS